jgi:hypothetical protein
MYDNKMQEFLAPRNGRREKPVKDQVTPQLEQLASLIVRGGHQVLFLSTVVIA